MEMFRAIVILIIGFILTFTAYKLYMISYTGANPFQ